MEREKANEPAVKLTGVALASVTSLATAVAGEAEGAIKEEQG
jgi:hypothetical protein